MQEEHQVGDDKKVVNSDLLEKLDEAARVGLDMSPGDPLAAKAAEAIRNLEKDKHDRDDVKEQAAAEMHRKGRDGAYLEVDLSSPSPLKDLHDARMVVVHGYRLEISDPSQVDALRTAVDKSILDGETAGMDDAQAWLYVFRKVFSTGLMAYIPVEEKGVDSGNPVL